MNKKYDIYKIRNTINDKVYIGQAVQYMKRKDTYVEHGWKHRIAIHFQNAFGESVKSKDHPKLYNAIRKYGKNAFEYSLVTSCDEADVNDMETYYIKHYNSVENGYNITYGGQDRRPYDLDNLAKKIASLWEDENYRNNQMSKKKRTQDLPYGITYSRSNKGDIVGYHLSISRNSKTYRKTFGPGKYKNYTLDERLDLAVKYRDELLAKLNEESKNSKDNV